MYLTIVYPIYIISINCILWIPYLSLWILSSNRQAFKLVITSFETAFKTYFILNFVISIFINQYILHSQQFGQLIYIQTISNILNAISLFLIFWCIFVFDASTSKVYWKIALTFIVAILLTFRTTVLFLLLKSDDNSIIYIPFTNIQVSLYNVEMTSARVLAIFAWKQAILTFYRAKKGKNQSVLIKCYPYIKWDDDNDNEEKKINKIIDTQNDNDDKNNPLQIIKTLGIDNILAYYISNVSLIQSQISLIHKLITTETVTTETVTTIKKCVNKNDIDVEDNHYYIHFMHSNSYLQLYFGTKNQKMIRKYILYNKFVHFVILLAVIPYISLTFMPKYYYTAAEALNENSSNSEFHQNAAVSKIVFNGGVNIFT
eukprot:494219_1